MTVKFFIDEKDPKAYASYQKHMNWSPDNLDIRLVLESSFTSVAACICNDFQVAGASANRAIIAYMTIPPLSLTAQ